jgi:hypothetical protein
VGLQARVKRPSGKLTKWQSRRLPKPEAKVEPLSFEDYAAWLEIAKDTAWKKYRSIGPRANDLFDEMLKSFINSGKP